MVGSTLSGGWLDRRPPVRTTPQIGPDRPPNRAGPPHKSGRTTPPIGPDPPHKSGRPPVRTTSKSGRTTAPKWSGQPGQGGWAKGSGNNPSPSPSGPPLLSGPPTLTDIRQIWHRVQTCPYRVSGTSDGRAVDHDFPAFFPPCASSGSILDATEAPAPPAPAPAREQ